MRTLEELNEEIEECNRCICGLFRTMDTLGVPEDQKCSNIMVQAYAKRLETAEEEKKLLLTQTT